MFGPLKVAWADVCHSFFKEKPGQVVSKLNFCRLFHSAWLNAVTPHNISIGFKKAGIWPFNPDVVKRVSGDKECEHYEGASDGPQSNDGPQSGGEGGDECGGASGGEGGDQCDNAIAAEEGDGSA